ncbi:MAG: DUF1284 domain-containing protein [Nitrospirae bacterium]|nr:DUF1284 domain-containing protein [Nitrospirota bacterium]
MTDLVTEDSSSALIRLRGHTLLCLQGFRGEGYSSEFIANVAAINGTLTDHPEVLVEVLASPDAVCAACPHRHPSGCTLNGERSEEEMMEQDHEALRRLELKAGDRLRWREILVRIRASVTGDDLPSICGGCRWLPLGYCGEGINRLHNPLQATTVGLVLPQSLRKG